MAGFGKSFSSPSGMSDFAVPRSRSRSERSTVSSLPCWPRSVSPVAVSAARTPVTVRPSLSSAWYST